MTDYASLIRSIDEITPDRRRGGEIRTLLSPKTVGSTSGFLGVARIACGEAIAEHYHPYSEEFVYVTAGKLCAELDGIPYELMAGQGVMIPPTVRHRLSNCALEATSLVFHLSPLAPRPELGHVDTEAAPASPVL